MDSTKVKKYKRWYYIFLGLGLFGLLDIVVGVLMKQSGSEGSGDLGLSFIIIYAFKYLFGTKVAGSILPFIMGISFTWFVWLGVSAILRRKIKKLEKESGTMGENKPVASN